MIVLGFDCREGLAVDDISLSSCSSCSDLTAGDFELKVSGTRRCCARPSSYRRFLSCERKVKFFSPFIISSKCESPSEIRSACWRCTASSSDFLALSLVTSCSASLSSCKVLVFRASRRATSDLNLAFVLSDSSSFFWYIVFLVMASSYFLLRLVRSSSRSNILASNLSSAVCCSCRTWLWLTSEGGE